MSSRRYQACWAHWSPSSSTQQFDEQPQVPSLLGSLVPKQQHTAATSCSEESRRLHQDHKAIKRAIDRTSQESASSFSSLHEKASKISISIGDLHSDVKRLERSLVFEAESPVRPTIADMESRLSTIICSLEAKVVACISEQITKSVNAKMGELLRQIEDWGLNRHVAANEHRPDLSAVLSSIDGVKEMVLRLQDIVLQRAALPDAACCALHHFAEFAKHAQEETGWLCSHFQQA
ncbi:hypothetical protein GQ54DRAFT_337635 [Martensiomyces pterosporus]|nr:hypothetical protein GQ54DRAFT_337635 [Martensiomyces pterosporus]